jgi:hypothetical protein
MLRRSESLAPSSTEPSSPPRSAGALHNINIDVAGLWTSPESFTRLRVAVHGIRNKGQAIPARDIETARTRTHDWKQRVEA